MLRWWCRFCWGSLAQHTRSCLSTHTCAVHVYVLVCNLQAIVRLRLFSELLIAGAMAVLDLSSNNLTGSIPAALASLLIVYVDLSSNMLTGTLPTYLQNMRPHTLKFSSNALVGSLPPSFPPHSIKVTALILCQLPSNACVATRVSAACLPACMQQCLCRVVAVNMHLGDSNAPAAFG